VGGNEFRPGNEPQDRALAAWCGQRPAHVVVTAAVRHDPDAAVRHAVDWFAALGLPMTELPMRNRTQAKSDETVEAARAAGATYLCGGDPGIVVTTLRDTAGWNALVGAWRDGAALAGSSAGAMALGEWTLLKGRMPGDHERRYADALNLVPGVAVIPHWDEFGATWAPSAEAGRPRPDVGLLGLDAGTAAAWDGAVWRAMGRGRVIVIAPDGERTSFRDGAPIAGLPEPR
jgi:cyanophycinase